MGYSSMPESINEKLRPTIHFYNWKHLPAALKGFTAFICTSILQIPQCQAVFVLVETVIVFLVFEYSLKLTIEDTQILVVCGHTHLPCFVPTLNSLQLFKQQQ